MCFVLKIAFENKKGKKSSAEKSSTITIVFKSGGRAACEVDGVWSWLLPSSGIPIMWSHGDSTLGVIII